MFNLNKFKNGRNSFVDKTITLQEVLNTIKHGDDNLNKITYLRQLGKSHPTFDDEKMTLPSFRFNFLFKTKALNDNIIGPTGLIYIDVDKTELINTHPLILASWKSVSQTGYGILVKVIGLTKDNYKDTYNAISAELGLNTDVGARKATQQTIQSYDPNLYYNENSITFTAVNKKVSLVNIQKREKELIIPKDTFLKYEKLRFDNTSDYFVDSDEDYITFNEKEKLCIPFIPRRVDSGNRNKTMFFVLSQYALLNPECGAQILIKLAGAINERFMDKYTDDKISSIVGAVMTKRTNNTLEPWFNKERRIIFNPNKKMTITEKRKIIGKEVGRIKTDKTRNEIYSTVEGWDFNLHGKITQTKVAEAIGKTVLTVKRNWEDVKDLVKVMNNDFKGGISYEKVKDNIEDQIEEKVSEIASNEVVEVLLDKNVISSKLQSILFREFDDEFPERFIEMQSYATNPSKYTIEEYNAYFNTINKIYANQ